MISRNLYSSNSEVAGLSLQSLSTMIKRELSPQYEYQELLDSLLKHLHQGMAEASYLKFLRLLLTNTPLTLTEM